MVGISRLAPCYALPMTLELRPCETKTTSTAAQAAVERMISVLLASVRRARLAAKRLAKRAMSPSLTC